MLQFSVPPGYRRSAPVRRPKLDEFTGLIEQWLGDDRRHGYRKQRHTAKRIFERLRDEHGFTGGYTIVKDYVREHRRRRREMFVPLTHPPGHAQADFGEAWAVIAGAKQKVHFFAFDLPQSDTSYVWAYRAATAEAWVDGHVHAFSFFGAVALSIEASHPRAAERGKPVAARPREPRSGPIRRSSAHRRANARAVPRPVPGRAVRPDGRRHAAGTATRRALPSLGNSRGRRRNAGSASRRRSSTGGQSSPEPVTAYPRGVTSRSRCNSGESSRSATRAKSKPQRNSANRSPRCRRAHHRSRAGGTGGTERVGDPSRVKLVGTTGEYHKVWGQTAMAASTRSGRSSKAGIPVSSTSRTQTTRSMISPLDPTDLGVSQVRRLFQAGQAAARACQSRGSTGAVRIRTAAGAHRPVAWRRWPPRCLMHYSMRTDHRQCAPDPSPRRSAPRWGPGRSGNEPVPGFCRTKAVYSDTVIRWVTPSREGGRQEDPGIPSVPAC